MQYNVSNPPPILSLSLFQVTASSWLNDLRDQIQQTRFLNAVYRSATALGTRLQSFSGARARVAGAGALLRPVSSKTLVTYLYRKLANCNSWMKYVPHNVLLWGFLRT